MKKSDKDKEKHFDSLTHVNNKIIQNIVNNESKKKFDGKKISEILVNEELIKIIHENGQKNLLYNIIIDEKSYYYNSIYALKKNRKNNEIYVFIHDINAFYGNLFEIFKNNEIESYKKDNIQKSGTCTYFANYYYLKYFYFKNIDNFDDYINYGKKIMFKNFLKNFQEVTIMTQNINQIINCANIFNNNLYRMTFNKYHIIKNDVKLFKNKLDNLYSRCDHHNYDEDYKKKTISYKFTSHIIDYDVKKIWDDYIDPICKKILINHIDIENLSTGMMKLCAKNKNNNAKNFNSSFVFGFAFFFAIIPSFFLISAH